MMDTWIVHLHAQRLVLFHQKLNLAEQMVQTIEEVLSETRINLTPTLLKSVQTLFEVLLTEINTFPRTTLAALKQRFEKVHAHYQCVAQFTQHFLKYVLRPETFIIKTHPVAHWTVWQFDRQQVQEWVQAYGTLVSSNGYRSL